MVTVYIRGMSLDPATSFHYCLYLGQYISNFMHLEKLQPKLSFHE